MKYMLLLLGDEQEWANMSEADRAALMERHDAFSRALGARNALLGGEELALSSTATTVRKEDGKAIVTDGPFAEVTEHLGGFYLIEAADLDEALSYARMLPEHVEIRPVIDHSA